MTDRHINTERFEGNLPAAGTGNVGALVTAHASDPTAKGTIVELVAATVRTNFELLVSVSAVAVNAAATASLVDILVGGSGAEQVLIANLMAGAAGSYVGQDRGPKVWRFNLRIEKGVRLSARIASERAANTGRVAVRLSDHGGKPRWRCGTVVDTVGIGTVPAGTAVTPGASGAAGAWAQMSASLAKNYISCLPSAQVAGADTSVANRMYMLDVGIGAAAAEAVVGSRIYTTDQVEAMSGPLGDDGPIFQSLPSGSRLAVRMSGSGTVDGMEAALHLVR